jgi:ketosteroid isomerase-like protein
MKITLPTLILVFCFSISAQAQSLNKAHEDYDTDSLNSFMDSWHLAAAQADAERFFGMMAEDGIYIGTDKTERWLRDELREWSTKAFERESAWTFTSKERNWQIHEKEGFAIADELLDTWMGPCRATAVIRLKNEHWEIIHYQLSVTIDNDKIEQFKNL